MEPTEEQRSFVDKLVEDCAEAIIVEVLNYHVMGDMVSKEHLEQMRKVVKHRLYTFGASLSHEVWREMVEKGHSKSVADVSSKGRQ